MPFISPEENVSRLNLDPNMVVADFGSGSGSYSIALAKSLPAGKVISFDVQKEMLDRLKRMSLDSGLTNINVVWADLEVRGSTKLADRSVDAVVLSNMLFQVDAKYSVVLEIKRVIKPGGKVMAIEWSGSFGHIGPRPEDVIEENQLIDIFTQAGFRKLNSFKSGDQHYGVIFIA